MVGHRMAVRFRKGVFVSTVINGIGEVAFDITSNEADRPRVYQGELTKSSSLSGKLPKDTKLPLTVGDTRLVFITASYILEDDELIIYYGRLYKLKPKGVKAKEVNGMKGWAAMVCLRHPSPRFLFTDAIKPAPKCEH